ncbi:MAG: GNAT family N-acetyltransferase [Polaromonas sp.]|uniref:GNAT family N-acetyltransferase n=1 Tax=Polaromonas sp. TaxID=1869339 RepID=UPI0024874B6B|nr:GNAT family N-acetyltransferase [Polaromonas sp.]MDI1239134.1 GNAT family N-acetyltransferase [Polaromonas sp.]
MKKEKTVGTVTENDYVIRVLDSPLQVPAADWNALLVAQPGDASLNPFMRHEYLAAMLESGSATPQTGWTARFVTLSLGAQLVGACALYLKDHSYGEYVFDHAWANAYHQHGLPYYPKALVAPPFTPVPGPRLLARDAATRTRLVKALVAWCGEEELSSLHLLFVTDEDVAACEEAGLMLRHNVQFHWTNTAPTLVASRTALPPEGALRLRPGKAGSAALAGNNNAPTLGTDVSSLPPEGALRLRPGKAGSAAPAGEEGEGRPFRDFDDFLMSLSQEKRKKIRQERRKVQEAGVRFRWSLGKNISAADWNFFYRCYERTYYEHGNAPYLSRDFFQRMQATMPENWLLFVAERDGTPIATSLIAVSAGGMAPTLGTGVSSLPSEGAELARGGPSLRSPRATGQFDDTNPVKVAYGRYWGALERVDCLHFEACYYQPLQWCITHGYQRFEGGAQGEHKMARALLPVKTTSAHWLAHPAFADAVERFLEREGEGMAGYMEELERRNPFRQAGPGGHASP